MSLYFWDKIASVLVFLGLAATLAAILFLVNEHEKQPFYVGTEMQIECWEWSVEFPYEVGGLMYEALDDKKISLEEYEKMKEQYKISKLNDLQNKGRMLGIY